MAPGKRIRTVLYGDQTVSPAELELLHTPALQRLYDLHQLGLTDRVFIDASHARLQHVVGVLEQVSKITEALIENLRKRPDRTLRIGATAQARSFSAKELADLVSLSRPVTRLIGLLHDLTHAPFGHTVEDEIQLTTSKHDDPKRQADAFYRLLCQYVAWLGQESGLEIPPSLSPSLSGGYDADLPAPDVVRGFAVRLLTSVPSEVIAASWRLKPAAVAELLSHMDAAMTALLHLEALHSRKISPEHLPVAEPYPFQTAIRSALTEAGFSKLSERHRFDPYRDAYMLDIVGNTVCADLLDYAKRDCHFSGLRLDYDTDRITENFTLVSFCAGSYEREHESDQSGAAEVGPFAGWCLRTAISLFSHKFRTDVPGELINLLNVRLYLYERVIFHPTKTAAGAMLGSALQLIGWRRHSDGTVVDLPPRVRYLGDAVFLSDVQAAARVAVTILEGRAPGHVVGDDDLKAAQTFADCHHGLVGEIVSLRRTRPAAQAVTEIKGGLRLLERLTSRRYLRPVFRALASSWDNRLNGGPETLAKAFGDPYMRYAVEREIENEAGLQPGSVVIHCPRRKTAEKIANALMVKPGSPADEYVDEVRKLRDIDKLNPDVFGKHGDSVRAGERTYRSMWRLTVFVAPEYMYRFQELEAFIGRAIFRTMDVHQQYAEQADLFWKNDPSLNLELEMKLAGRQTNESDTAGDARTVGDAATASAFASNVAKAVDDLILSGAGQLDVLGFGEDSTLSPTEIKERLLELLAKVGPAPVSPNADARWKKIEPVVRSYRQKISSKQIASIRTRYARRLTEMTEDEFERAFATVSHKVDSTPREFRTVEHSQRKEGNRLRELVDALDKAFGVRADVPRDLFSKFDQE